MSWIRQRGLIATRRIALDSYTTNSADTSSPSTSLHQQPKIQHDQNTKALLLFVTERYPRELSELNRKIIKTETQRQSEINFSQSCEDFGLKVHRHDKLLDMLSSSVISSKCKLIPVGSSVNGLHNSSSDLDLIFHVVEGETRTSFFKEFFRNHTLRGSFMNILQELIVRELEKQGIEHYSSDVLSEVFSGVPLISMRFNNNLKVDIQFAESYQALRNTNLVRTYLQADVRFAQLYLWVRTVFNELGVRAGRYGLLSSYHLLMLTIHYLQCESCHNPWPVLPVLCKTHPDLVSPSLTVDQTIAILENPQKELHWISNNKMTVAELAIGLVEYYYSLNFFNHAIFIDRGQVRKRRQTSGTEATIQLFDPYGSQSVAKSIFALQAFRDSIVFLRKMFIKGLMIDSFPEFPECQLFHEETKTSKWHLVRQQLRTQQKSGS